MEKTFLNVRKGLTVFENWLFTIGPFESNLEK